MNTDQQSSRVRLLREALQSIHPLASQYNEVRAYQQKMFALLDDSSDYALSRDRIHAHFTVSAFIFSSKGACLALFHKKLQRWLQPGGHLEKQDLSPIAGALREAQEESGLLDLIPLYPHPIDLDIHLIPARRDETAHEHYDLRFAFSTRTPHLAHISEESNDLQWLQDESLETWGLSSTSIERPLKVASVLIRSQL